MKVEIELPKLEVIIEAAKKRGFDITLKPIHVTDYEVMVSCNGHSRDAVVKENCHGKVTLDTDMWWRDNDTKDRLRISAHKKVHVIGDRVGWMLGAIKTGRKK